jgi:hypothetical protein
VIPTIVVKALPGRPLDLKVIELPEQLTLLT